jgi:hypothetical protein
MSRFDPDHNIWALAERPELQPAQESGDRTGFFAGHAIPVPPQKDRRVPQAPPAAVPACLQLHITISKNSPCGVLSREGGRHRNETKMVVFCLLHLSFPRHENVNCREILDCYELSHSSFPFGFNAPLIWRKNFQCRSRCIMSRAVNIRSELLCIVTHWFLGIPRYVIQPLPRPPPSGNARYNTRPESAVNEKMERLFFNCFFDLCHEIWRDYINLVCTLCVIRNLFHQLCFGRSGCLEFTVHTNILACKRWHPGSPAPRFIRFYL